MTGAILGGIGLVLLSLLGFMTGIVLIFAKMMLTLMLGLAPIMIALSLFDATKDFFHRWVSTTISYAFYPIVIAAMFSTVVGMANSLLAQLGDPNSATNIGSLVPFFVMVFLAKGFVAATPLIVRGISGNLMVAAAPAIVSGSAGVLRGLVNTSGVQGRARIGALTTGNEAMTGAQVAVRLGACVGVHHSIILCGDILRCGDRMAMPRHAVSGGQQPYGCIRAERA
jgi:type IV secretion system protein VirB6